MRVINRVKAVAINESTGSSVAVAQEFKKYAPTGIGMVLEQVHGLRGIYVIKVVPGGAAWRANEVRVGDEIRMIDNIVIQDMELDEVTGLILGPPGDEVCGSAGAGASLRLVFIAASCASS
jgi:C-terminal processing protease CtpA/Prc